LKISGEGVEDLLGRFLPDEGLGVVVPLPYPVANVGLEGLGGFVDATMSSYKTDGDNGDIVVAENGFSTIPKENDFDRLSYGAVLENHHRTAVAFPTYTATLGADQRPGTVHQAHGRSGANRTRASGRTALTFTIDSAFAQPIPRVDASAIFRERGGRIVGGNDHVISRNDWDSADVPPGRSVHELVVKEGVPSGADDGRTEVYVFPSVWPLP
jgi:hypothetical protein